MFINLFFSLRFSLSCCHVLFIYIIYNKFNKFLYHEIHLHIFHIYIFLSRSRFVFNSDEKRFYFITIFKSFSRSPIFLFREFFIKLCHIKSTFITNWANFYIMNFLHIFIIDLLFRKHNSESLKFIKNVSYTARCLKKVQES